MKIDKVVMTTDADVKTEKVEAPIDVDVDSMITIDNDCLYRRSVLDDMDLVEESYSLLQESADDIPKDFVDFAFNFYNDLRDEFERPVQRAKFPIGSAYNDIKKTKPRKQYVFRIRDFRTKNVDPFEIKKNIAQKYGMIKLYDAVGIDLGTGVIYGKVSDDKKHIYAITHLDVKGDQGNEEGKGNMNIIGMINNTSIFMIEPPLRGKIVF